MYLFISTRTVYLSKHLYSVCYHIRINLNLQIQLRRRKLTFFLNHCLLYSRKLRKRTNTCVWERQDFWRWLFIISPSTVMATGDCRSTWNPAAITQEVMTPSKGPGAHIKDKGPAFPRGQEKPLYGNCSAFIIRLWTNPSVTWRNNAEKTGKSSYNGP